MPKALNLRYPRLTAALALCGLNSIVVPLALSQTQTSSEQQNSSLPFCQSKSEIDYLKSFSTLWKDEFGALSLIINIEQTLGDNLTLAPHDSFNDIMHKQFESGEIHLNMLYTLSETMELTFDSSKAELILPEISIETDSGVLRTAEYDVEFIQVADEAHIVSNNAVTSTDMLEKQTLNYHLNEATSQSIFRAWDNNNPVLITFQWEKYFPKYYYAVVTNKSWPKISDRVNVQTAEMLEDFAAGKCQPDAAVDDIDCFFTTAAVHQVGLADDCWELTCLRQFRDSKLQETSTGRELVQQYYAEAPGIVARINQRDDSTSIWLRTYWLGIVPSAILAKLNLNSMATKMYKRLFYRLKAY